MDLISTNALGGGIYHPSYFNTYLSSITNAEKLHGGGFRM